MKKKLTYDDIRLNGKVLLPSLLGGREGVIRQIKNFSDMGVDEPIFTVYNPHTTGHEHFGLKYILKYYIQN